MDKHNICKFYVKKNCNHGDKCKFIHEDNICRNYFFDGKCPKNDQCKFKHTYIINKNEKKNEKQNENQNKNEKTHINKHNHNRKRVKNTENFEPCHDLCDMNILVSKSQETYGENDIVIVPNFIQDNFTNETYNKLLQEIEQTGIDENKLWKEWHGDSHLIADDSLNWKNKTPTFNEIIDKIEKYFHMETKATRFNLYEDSSDWKPFHHDAAAVKEHIAKIQNFTVGVSLGATRHIAFEHAKTKTTISIPLENGYAYAFSKNINIIWKHGVLQVHPDKAFTEGRISIIAWGQIDLAR